MKELIADREFKEGRVITLLEIAESAGVHRITLSKLANKKGYNVTSDVLDRLCAYFNCRIEQLVEYIPDEQMPS
ncbi:helix-turn-helix domain-containing protein [Pseudothauera nasutitermitis]|uniref:helix-turn-helix domain-containing protein n=1 Tax=Pseudothauera nasutitermitis TaxID=2565930 RepID=UPI001E2D19F3|nr:helix-turn-helix transcriptional regulator [Pseudothauera nasutitermitis]